MIAAARSMVCVETATRWKQVAGDHQQFGVGMVPLPYNTLQRTEAFFSELRLMDRIGGELHAKMDIGGGDDLHARPRRESRDTVPGGFEPPPTEPNSVVLPLHHGTLM